MTSVWREDILEQLPLSDDALVAAARAAAASDEDLEFARAANRQVATLRSLDRPALPESLEASSFLARLHDDVVRGSSAAPALAAHLVPTTAPCDVDWGAAVIEHFAERTAITADIGRLADGVPPTPGWLWLRIRRDVSTARAHQVLVRRVALVAAVVVASLGLATSLGLFERSATPHYTFVVQRVDQPLASEFSIGAILSEVRRGQH